MDTNQTLKSHLHLVSTYFDTWNLNDASKLRELFHDDITLSDWEISASGIDNVIKENESIFKAVSKVEVVERNIDIIDDTAYCAIKINVFERNKSKANVLNVLDVIKIKVDKIISIKAYLG